jgi:hypothetical protein
LLQIELGAFANGPTGNERFTIFRYTGNLPQRVDVALSPAFLGFATHELTDDFRNTYAVPTRSLGKELYLPMPEGYLKAMHRSGHYTTPNE